MIDKNNQVLELKEPLEITVDSSELELIIHTSYLRHFPLFAYEWVEETIYPFCYEGEID